MHPPLPSQTDSAEVVRFYLADTLQAVYSTEQKQAQETANLWKIGTGETLRTLLSQGFIDIFGTETGWILFSDTQNQLSRLASKPKSLHSCRRCQSLILHTEPTSLQLTVIPGIPLCILLWLGSALAILSQYPSLRPWLRWVWIIGVAIAFMAASEKPFSKSMVIEGLSYGIGVVFWMKLLPWMGVDLDKGWRWWKNDGGR